MSVRGLTVLAALVPVFIAAVVALMPSVLAEELAILTYMGARYLHEGISLKYLPRDYQGWRWAYKPNTSYIFAEETMSYAGGTARTWSRRGKILEPAVVRPEDNHSTKICKHALYTIFSSIPEGDPAMQTLPGPDPITPEEKVQIFLEECLKVYKGLDPSGRHRQVLDNLTPKFGVNITRSGEQYVPDEEVPGLIKRREALGDAHADYPRATEAVIGRWGPLFAKNGVKLAKTPVIDASEIPEYFRLGKVARFNATRFVPPHLLNKRVPEYVAQQGESAKTTPVMCDAIAHPPWKFLDEYKERFEAWERAGLIWFPENRPFGASKDGFTAEEEAQYVWQRTDHTWWLRKLAKLLKPLIGEEPAEMYLATRTYYTAAATHNSRRLENYGLDLAEVLGQPPWLERVWTAVWFGSGTGCWHFDEPDNAVIVLNGETTITTFEAADSWDIRAGGGRHCAHNNLVASLPFDPWYSPDVLTEHPWINKFPVHVVTLKAGEGMILPTGAMHHVSAATMDRTLVSGFFLPKFGELFDTPASKAKANYYRPEKQPPPYLALRHLKQTTLFRMWDNRRVGGFYEETATEYF